MSESCVIDGVRFNFNTRTVNEKRDPTVVEEWKFETPSGRKVRVRFFDGLVEMETKARIGCAMWKHLGTFLEGRSEDNYAPLFRKLSGTSLERVKRVYHKLQERHNW